jgi:hypothetical protein
VILFAGEHEAEAERTHMLARLPTVPRLRQRLAPTGRLAWDDDPDFSIERHVVGRGAANLPLDAFFRDLGHLSRSLERFAQRWAMSPRVFTLNVSNVPGPRGPQTVLGSPLLELQALGAAVGGSA